jgi:choline kinase
MLMNKRFIILAGTRQTDYESNYLKYYKDNGRKNSTDRWENYLNVSKHMIPIKGEPLIHRTQRILKEAGADEIFVKCDKESKDLYLINDSKFIDPPLSTDFSYPDYELFLCKDHYNSNGITVLLFGDVYYTKDIIDHIINNDSKSWHYYARKRFSEITGSVYGEHFGWYFHDSQIQKLLTAGEKACEITKDFVYRSENGESISRQEWNMQDSASITYRVLCNLNILDPYDTEDFHWIEWDDETDDFDYPSDWDTWSSRLPHLAY